MPKDKCAWILPRFGFQHLNGMKVHLMVLLRQGLCPIQVLAHHKVYVKKHGLRNELVTYDTFVFPSNVRN